MVTEGPVLAEQVVKVDEPRKRMASMAGGPSQLENATRDLFRLSGGQSIPVEARVPAEPKPKAAPAPARRPEPEPASGRKAESSILFSLESLMKAASTGEKKEESDDQQLWSMQAEAPLFGTAQDHALLTTPLDPPPGSNSMLDSMTVASRRPGSMRMLPMLLAAAGAGAVLLAGVGWFVLRPAGAEPAAAAAQALEAPAERSGSALEEPARTAEAAPALTAEPAISPPTSTPPAEAKPAETAVAAVGMAEPKEPEGKQPAPADEPKAGSDSKPAVPSRAVSSAKKPAPKPKPAAAPFNVAAAKEALNAAAAKAGSCSGASGKGKVQLTFAPTGKVSAASITEGPPASSAAGKCALRHFKAARVPAFSGPPQTVAKGFKLP